MEVVPTIVVGHGLLFSSSGRAGPTLAIRPGGQGDVTRTHLAWSSPRGIAIYSLANSPWQSTYMVNDMTSIATAFDARMERPLWQNRLGAAQREGFSASPVSSMARFSSRTMRVKRSSCAPAGFQSSPCEQPRRAYACVAGACRWPLVHPNCRVIFLRSGTNELPAYKFQRRNHAKQGVCWCGRVG